MEEFIKKQLNEGYNDKLNKLFEEWLCKWHDQLTDIYKNQLIESKVDDVRDLFCQDGLMVKYKDVNSGYDINMAWHESERKIMFIVKDCPDGSGYDTRTNLVGGDTENSKRNALNTRELKGRTRFFANIACMLYGLYYMTEDNKGEDLNTNADKKEKQRQAFNDLPFAYIEAKKISGGKNCPGPKLKEALKFGGAELLAEEIRILRPNIIVCCDNNGIIFDNLVQNYFGGKIPDNEHKWENTYTYENGEKDDFDYKMYYYEEDGVLLFNSFHPSSPEAKWKVREKVLSPFRQFFSKYKTFGRVSSDTHILNQCVDEEFANAARLVVKTKNASTAILQRRLGVGFMRAGRILKQMEKAGIIGEAEGYKAHPILVSNSAELENIITSFTERA